MATTKLYDCKHCGKTMMMEVFADEQTTLKIMEQNPYCGECDPQKPVGPDAHPEEAYKFSLLD